MNIFKMMIILIFILSCGGCSSDNSVEDTQTAIEKEEQENESMRREFCTIEEINNEYMVIKNTKGELYHIDSDLNEGFAVGAEIVLVYVERTKIEDNIYEATVQAIRPDNSTLLKPSN